MPETRQRADVDPNVLAILSRLDLRSGVGPAVRDRLVAGAREYGDRSLRRPVAELLAEAAEEPVDAIGWSVLAIHAMRHLEPLNPAAAFALYPAVDALVTDLTPIAARARDLAALAARLTSSPTETAHA